MSANEKDDLVLAYATLMLHDDGLGITQEKLLKIIKATGNEVGDKKVALFANAIKQHDIDSMLDDVAQA